MTGRFAFVCLRLCVGFVWHLGFFCLDISSFASCHFIMITYAMCRLSQSVMKFLACRSTPRITGSIQDHRCLFTSLMNHCKPLDVSRDFFELFSLSKKFALDTADLTNQFRLLQSQWHPDKFAGRNKVCKGKH